MSRPIKDGVDYWPFDVGFFRDKKMQLLKGEFGIKGLYIALEILNSVYENNGYYRLWDSDDCLLMSIGVGDGCTPDLVAEVLSGCLRRSVFNDGVFQMFGILTSSGIQRRYLRMVGNSRPEISIIKEYWLLDIDNKKDVQPSVINKLAFISIKTTDNPNKSTDNPQSKVKNSKVNNPPTPTGAFEAFWTEYPKKQSRQSAIKAWEKLSPSDELIASIMAALRKQRACPQWQKDGGQYIPYAATWLNQRRWEDETASDNQPTMLLQYYGGRE